MAVHSEQHFRPKKPSAPAFRPALLCVSFLLGVTASAQAPNPTSATNPFYGSVTAHARHRRSPQALARRSHRPRPQKQPRPQGSRERRKSLSRRKERGSAGVSAHRHRSPARPASTSTTWPRWASAPASLASSPRSFPAAKCRRALFHHPRRPHRRASSNSTRPSFPGPFLPDTRPPAQPSAPPTSPRCRRAARSSSKCASAYLHAIAAASEVDNAKALEAEDQVLLNQAHDAHVAGTAANLDELRARVQLQAQQQALISRRKRARKRPDPAQARNRRRPRPEDRPH